MHFLSSIAVAMAIAMPISATCTAPTTSYSTLPKLFTINALTSTRTYNIRLNPGTVDSNTYNKPLITSYTAAPSFNLTKGILRQNGLPANARYIPSGPNPTTVYEMLFGGNPTLPPNEVGFSAKYTCYMDKVILTLRQQAGFVAAGENEGAELYIQPKGYSGEPNIPVKVRINGGL